MNPTLQRHCAKYIYVIPEGLRELMNDISREVLRSQPEDIYTFIADYLDALIITRENARVAARIVENLIDLTITTATFLEATGSTREEIDRIVSVIRKTFDKTIEHSDFDQQSVEVEEANIVSTILHDANVSPSQAEISAQIIQRAYRSFKERKEREKELLQGMIDWRIAARSAIYLYRKTGVTNEEAERVATLIKAAYKGYYTRRMMKRFKIMVYEQERFMDTEDQYDSDRSLVDDQQKAVRINYDTVIPHVDFDESRTHRPTKVLRGSRPKHDSEEMHLTPDDSKIIEAHLHDEFGLPICKSIVSDIVAHALSQIFADIGQEGGAGDEDFISEELAEKEEIVIEDEPEMPNPDQNEAPNTADVPEELKDVQDVSEVAVEQPEVVENQEQ